MRADFVKNHPDVAKGYLRAELEAQRYMLDPANWENVINMVSKYATGIPKNVLWYSIYGLVPSDSSDPVREWKNFYFGDRENANIVEVAPFLFKSKIISMESSPTAPSTTRSPAKSSRKPDTLPPAPTPPSA
ncbi:MAG: hypothetical protein ACLSAH_03550 [Bilophila wadsworthia]